MTTEKKSILSQFTVGNVIASVVIIGAMVSTYLTMENHLSDDTIHVKDTEIKLTLEEYTTLIKWIDKFPIIDENQIRIIEIEKNEAVHKVEYDILYQEHESLEGKVSRNYVELRDLIIDNHD